MKTVSNARISVSVPDAEWEAMLTELSDHTAKLPSGDERTESAESVCRGRVLSEAMRRLGNTSELKLIQSEPPSPDQVRQHARRTLFIDHLRENSRYSVDEILMRHDGDHRLSRCAQEEVNNALAHADGLLSPIDLDQLMTLARDLYNADMSEVARRREVDRINLLRGADNDGAGAKAIEAALNALNWFWDTEKRYRAAHAQMGEWEISIIGDMPEQIGLCRFDRKNIIDQKNVW